MPKYSIFLSRKSSDAKMAKNVYDFLTMNGLQVFDSDISLDELGTSEYQSTIDHVIDHCEHIIVIGSSAENINSSWVKTEWETFENERRSGRKNGNILVVISRKVKIESLPLALRQKQVFIYEDKKFERLLPYLGEATIKNSTSEAISNKSMLWIGIAILLVFISLGIWYFNQKPHIIVNGKINSDSLLMVTEKQFLFEGLDKEIAFENFKKLIKEDIKYLPKTRAILEEKAKKTPFLKDKYLDYSEKLLIYADSVHQKK
ncbi:MAG: toll/interleukin-1 receptor domain-containing protein [Bacteroidetes bacterium]|nr:toll/interleukin-1 receptor domain-containing protein [Bacteroidota bacterium]